jgi:hypothetical protein
MNAKAACFRKRALHGPNREVCRIAISGLGPLL